MQHTTTQPRIAAITQRPLMNRPLFLVALAGFGIISIVSGVFGLVSALIPFLSTSMLALAAPTLFDAVFQLFLGGLILASAAAFNQGKILAVWIYGASIFIDSVYKLKLGDPLNYVFLAFGVLLIWQLLKFRDHWESL